MPSTGMIAQDQAQVPEQEQHPLAAEQTVQVIAEEQVPQAAGAPAAPANFDAPGNRRQVHRHRRQRTPPRVLYGIAYLFAWNRIYFHERRGRPEAAQDDSRIMVCVIQIYASMTYNDYEKLLSGAFLLCLSLLRPNIALVILAGRISPLVGPVLSAIVGSVNGDRKFCWLGLKNALFGIGISALMGFFIGLTLYGFGHFFSMVGSTAQDILYQCNYLSIFVRMHIAILTGAFSVLFVVSRSLLYSVRVAISSSLLLPAVRAGVQLGLGLATQMFQPGQHMCQSRFTSYNCQYSKHLEIEMIVSGLASVFQVALNLFWITTMSTFVLRWTLSNNRIPVLQNPR